MDRHKPLFQINDLKKYYPVKQTGLVNRTQLSLKANDGICLTLYEGETFGLVGESGCGKSTLGRVLLQLYSQTGGSVIYYGYSRRLFCPRYVKQLLTELKRSSKINHDITDNSDILHILGGLAAAPNVSDVADILLHEYCIGAKRATLIQKKAMLTKKKEALLACDCNDSHIQASIQSIDKSISSLTSKLVPLEEDLKQYEFKIDSLRTEYSNCEHFKEFEAHLDDGINLSLLTSSEMRLLRSELAIIFQDPYASLNPRMTIEQILCEVISSHHAIRNGSDEARYYAQQIMAECGLDEYIATRYPHQLSGGQRQRVGVARALAIRPKFIVCDEAISALDVSIQSQIINLLQDLKESRNLTYLFISHNLAVVRYISDRIGVMYLGSIVELASTDQLFSTPLHPYTKALIAAIPRVDCDSSDLEPLEGDIPNPLSVQKGCKFYSRCSLATSICSREIPALLEKNPDHFVACHNIVLPNKRTTEDGL